MGLKIGPSFVIISVANLCILHANCLRGQTDNYRAVEWMNQSDKIEFDAKEVPHIGLLNRLYWVEKNERSTSRNYTMWEKADLYLFEWPGNITTFDMDNRVVKWGRHRAKYIEDYCGKEHTGIEMRAYAYKYVYLTWGPFRLTSTYSPPLSVPRAILPYTSIGKLSRFHSYEENPLNTIVAFDIEFVFDALLIAYSEGIIRVSGLEMAWAEVSRSPRRPLAYSLSQGIHGGVDSIVVQKCCLKTDSCTFGNTVVAFRENSSPNLIFTSFDGGVTFKKLEPKLPILGRLKVVLAYPELSSLLMVHGNSSHTSLSYATLPPVAGLPVDKITAFTLATQGNVQGARLGSETSFVLWDDCSVWYSPDAEVNVTRSLLYLHKKITRRGAPNKFHRIVSSYCRMGRNSTLAYGSSGRFGILDKDNVFLLGVDAKSNLSQLVALKMDMSLLTRGLELSVVPYFDISEQPRLLYPPKYLEPPKILQLGRKYGRRLGMRLLPKNVYPSDFMLAFYNENAKLPLGKTMFGLKKCETSTLYVNNSITQRRKFYQVSGSGVLNFTIGFKSTSRSLKQLQLVPKYVLKYLRIKVRPLSIDMVQHEDPRYWIKYEVLVTPNSMSALNKVFRLVFYTKNALRCNVQPRAIVYVKVDENSVNTNLPELSEDDMSHETYLKAVTSGSVEYLDQQGKGEIFNVNTCPHAQKQ